MVVQSGKTALITGASTGIGAEFARKLGSRGMNLVLVACSEDKLKALADRLIKQHGISADIIVADLTKPDEVSRVVTTTRGLGREIHLLINNAGFATFGRFEEQDPNREQDEVSLNVLTLVALTHAYLPGMLERHAGGIIQVASIAGFQPVPYMAIYGATKAFVFSFSEALRNELKDTGVTVTALLPGPTETNFFHRADMDDTSVGVSKKDDPADVARDGFNALMAGKDKVIAGSLKTKVMGLASELVPPTVSAQVHRGMSEPGSGEK